MKFQSVPDYEAMSRLAAKKMFELIAAAAHAGRPFRLGLATGNTMLKVYEYLAEELNRNRTPLARLSTYNLDEYVGPDGRSVPDTHPLSYRRYMRENLFSRLDPALGFSEERAWFPDGDDPAGHDRRIAAAGGLDFQLLGIGFNGHIAFNEPMSESVISAADFAELPSRLIDLTETTIATNTRLTAGGDRELMPRQAVTQGMKAILESREILLLACFPEQEKPLRAIRTGRPTPELPASLLLTHPDATIVWTADCIHL